jgi:hypothetical protein
MPMMHDDEEPHDWEIKDEEPPERLQKKWDREKVQGHRKIVCRSCKKETSTENLTCIFCGAEIFEEGLFDRLLDWIRSLFRKN